MFQKIADWLDERTGWRAVVRHALDEPVPGGARWAYVFGSVLTFLIIEQMVTGILIASYYSASTGAAWASVAYLQDQVTGGWLVRGLHSAGASAMVILMLVHLLQTAIWGAYRKPREVNWILGVLMFGVTLGFALTGYLLPWDQKGYWATQVATSLAGAVPVVGKWILSLVQGGDAYGNLTLTRFYALHVFVLPGALLLLLAMHVALFRKHGVTPGWKQTPEELKRSTAPFWPDQLARDLVAIALTLAAMMLWVWRTHGAELEAPADPTAAYDARPEWYFLPLFQLLKYFPGRLEIIAAMGAPVALFGSLLILPFIDKGPDRSPRARLKYIALPAFVIVGAIGLGLLAVRDDAKSQSFQQQRERAHKEAARARELAKKGMPPAGGVAVFDNDPERAARLLFAVRCAGCHLFEGVGENKGPTLDAWASRETIRGILKDPDAERYFGKSGVSGMKPVKGEEAEISALVEYVYSLSGEKSEGPNPAIDTALRDRGAELFKDKDCDGCHETDGTTAGQGAPNLGGWGTVAWWKDFIRDPGAGRFYGKKNKMPKFGDKLTDEEIESLAKLVAAQRTRR